MVKRQAKFPQYEGVDKELDAIVSQFNREITTKADKFTATKISYNSDSESAAYTGAADSEAKLADLNALRAAYENLRTLTEAMLSALRSKGLLS